MYIKEDFFKKIGNRKVTAKELSKAIGVSAGNITDWKQGRSRPNIDALTKIADYLDCSVDYLLGRTDNPEVNRSAKKHTLAEYSEIAALGGSMTRDALIDDDFDTTLPEK